MALPFLKDVADLGKLGMGAFALLKSDDEPEGLDELIAAARESQRYTQAAVNPDDPMFQRLAAAEEEAMTRDFAGAIRQIMNQNQRARARGTAGFFNNQERRDESVARAMAAHNVTVKDQARNNARNYLLSAAGKNQVAMQGYGTAAQLTGAATSARRQEQADLWRGLFSGVGAIGEHGFFPHTRGLLSGDPKEGLQTDMRDQNPIITPATG